MRPDGSELAVIGARGIQSGIAQLDHPRGAVARSHDILRSARSDARGSRARLELEDACVGTAKNGTYVPASIVADEKFWRIVGLYLAEGTISVDGRRHGCVELPSRPTRATWWSEVAASGVRTGRQGDGASRSDAANGHDRLPHSGELVDERPRPWNELLRAASARSDLERAGDAQARDTRRRVAGDGSWSYLNRGRASRSSTAPSAGSSRTVCCGCSATSASSRGSRSGGRRSRPCRYVLARRLRRGSGGAAARPRRGFGRDLESIAKQAKRIAPTGYKRGENAAWVRVVSVERKHYDGYVYSMEVDPSHTLVTSYGLIASNCFPKGRDRAQAARRQRRIPVHAPARGVGGERAPEAARRPEAAEASRPAARQEDRAARPRVQAEHRRHARGAEPRDRVPAALRRARRCARGIRSRIPTTCAASSSATRCSTRCATPTPR